MELKVDLMIFNNRKEKYFILYIIYLLWLRSSRCIWQTINKAVHHDSFKSSLAISKSVTANQCYEIIKKMGESCNKKFLSFFDKNSSKLAAKAVENQCYKWLLFDFTVPCTFFLLWAFGCTFLCFLALRILLDSMMALHLHINSQENAENSCIVTILNYWIWEYLEKLVDLTNREFEINWFTMT